MKKVLIILIVGLTLSSCIFTPEGRKRKVFSDQLKRRKDYVIPDSLYSFFPNNVKDYNYKSMELGFTIENFWGKGGGRLWYFSESSLVEVYICYDDKVKKQLIERLRQQSLGSINSEDRNYFIIRSENDLFNEYDTLQLDSLYRLSEEQPLIADFKTFLDFKDALYSAETICGLPTGYKILTLKSGNKKVLPKEYLYDWSILPDEIKHGYRCGVAFKEGEPYLIYWVVAW